ncbi:hypothetical protein CHELA40_14743 [Chelatococcus asaccharovorans]|nr:hypothetical protein CHELA17_60877 [Chelatococcus asaccharovorans]CAH1679667.1 hypothetical protein CHELA40_14743 [Chelatococcus asaccharovorans]
MVKSPQAGNRPVPAEAARSEPVARVIVACRDEAQADEAMRRIRQTTPGRIATRYDKLASTFPSVAHLADVVAYWLDCVWVQRGAACSSHFEPILRPMSRTRSATTTRSDPTARSDTTSRSTCIIPVAHPARQRDQSRKTPAAGDPRLGSRAQGGSVSWQLGRQKGLEL